MKRKQLIKELLEAGCEFQRHGSRHDIYVNPSNGMTQPIPRHSEIHNKLARHIKKYLGVF